MSVVKNKVRQCFNSVVDQGYGHFNLEHDGEYLFVSSKENGVMIKIADSFLCVESDAGGIYKFDTDKLSKAESYVSIDSFMEASRSGDYAKIYPMKIFSKNTTEIIGIPLLFYSTLLGLVNDIGTLQQR